MYSFGSRNLVGKGNVSYNKYSHSSIFSQIKIGLDAQKYLYNQNREYVRISPSVRLTLKKPSLRDKKEKYLTASYIHLDKEEENIQFTDLGYIFSNARTINPYSIHVNLENSNTFTKTDIIFNSTLNKKIMIRAYVGGMIRSGDERYNLQMSAWNGLNDYTFSERSLARSDSSGSYSTRSRFLNSPPQPLDAPDTQHHPYAYLGFVNLTKKYKEESRQRTRTQTPKDGA